MRPPRHASLLRLHVDAIDRWRGVPLYRAVVERARALGMAGASVFSVELGYGDGGPVHDALSEYSSYATPVVIELVDAPERLATLVNQLDGIVAAGLLTIRSVLVHQPGEPVGQDIMANEQMGRFQGGDPAMKIEGEARRVTAYIGSSDTRGGRNLAVAIVEECRALGMAGATVSRGIMGFGRNSVVHRAHLLGLSEDLPERVEIVDRPEAIDRLLPVLDAMIGGGLVVIEDVHVVRYRHGGEG